jgi:hypothetical protein
MKMKLRSNPAALLCLFFASLVLNPVRAALAQHEAGQVEGPSKYLMIHNVELKPNVGSAFIKIESDEVAAMRAAHAPGHYLALWHITGGNNVLFTRGFDSFADIQKVHDDTVAMSQLEDTLKADTVQEAPLVAQSHSSIYEYQKDLSFNPEVDLSTMRFMRILLFHVRSGHDQDFRHLVKLYIKGYQSAVPDARWAMFQKIYGEGSDNVYILITPMDKLAYVDAIEASDSKFSEAVGEDQLQLLEQGTSAAIESSESDLFALSPDISYTPDSWLTASPDFWGKK